MNGKQYPQPDIISKIKFCIYILHLHVWILRLGGNENGLVQNLLWPFLPSVSPLLLPPTLTSQWEDPAARCQLIWPEGAGRGHRRQGLKQRNRGRGDWATILLLAGKHIVYPQHHLPSSSCISSLSLTVYPLSTASVPPHLLFAPQPIFGSVQISHCVTTPKRSHQIVLTFWGKHTIQTVLETK